ISWNRPSFSICFFRALRADSIWLSTTSILTGAARPVPSTAPEVRCRPPRPRGNRPIHHVHLAEAHPALGDRPRDRRIRLPGFLDDLARRIYDSPAPVGTSWNGYRHHVHACSSWSLDSNRGGHREGGAMAGEVLAGALLSSPDAERHATGPKARRAPAP